MSWCRGRGNCICRGDWCPRATESWAYRRLREGGCEGLLLIGRGGREWDSVGGVARRES